MRISGAYYSYSNLHLRQSSTSSYSKDDKNPKFWYCVTPKKPKIHEEAEHNALSEPPVVETHEKETKQPKSQKITCPAKKKKTFITPPPHHTRSFHVIQFP